jgi:hypothetical protein
MKIFFVFIALMAACGCVQRAQSFQIVRSVPTLPQRSALGVVSHEVTDLDVLVAATVCVAPHAVAFGFGYGLASIVLDICEYRQIVADRQAAADRSRKENDRHQ